MSGVDLTLDRGARRARELATEILAEFAPADGTLVTREGPVAYARGDALLTGSEGERRPVQRRRFDETYEPIAPLRPGKPGLYRRRSQVVWAKAMREPFVVELGSGRGTLRGRPGDWLLQYAPGDQGVVSGTVFAKTYELLD